MTTETNTTTTEPIEIVEAPAKKSRRKLVIAAVTACAVVAAGAGIPLTLNAMEQQRIADRTQQAEDAREAIEDALGALETARGEFVDGSLSPLFLDEGEELALITQVGEYVTAATGRIDLLGEEAIVALTTAHSAYAAGKDAIFEAYTTEAITPEVVLPKAAEYIDEDTFAGAAKRDAKTVKDIKAAIDQFQEVEFTFDIDGESITIAITGAKDYFGGLIADLAGTAPAKAEAFVGTAALASQEARDAVVANAKTFEGENTIENLTTYLASGTAATEAHAAAEAAAAAAAQQKTSGGKKSSGGSYKGGSNGGSGAGGSTGGSGAGGSTGGSSVGPRGIINPRGVACSGSGGSASASWNSNLVPPADAINVRVTFENPGVSWGIAWSCDLGF